MINTTSFTNYSGNFMVGIGQAINTESGGLFGFLILLAFYFITFSATLRWGTETAFVTTAFIGAIVAVLLRLMNWVYDPVLYGAIVLLIIGIVIQRLKD